MTPGGFPSGRERQRCAVPPRADCWPRQAEVVAQRQSRVVAVIQPSPLELWHHVVNEIRITAWYIRRRDDEAIACPFGKHFLQPVCDIPRGVTITREMLTVKRPGFGVKPKYIDTLVGRVATVDIEADEVITWEMV